MIAKYCRSLNKSRRGLSRIAAIVVAASAILPAIPALAQNKPIRIGFAMSVTGGLAAAGKSAVVASNIWRDNVNAAGGLLGRQVELVTYDDQSNPALVPAIYTKLLDIDKVDLILSGYATNQIAPAMPIAVQRKKLMLALHGLGNNEEIRYDRYFHVVPYGPSPKKDWLADFWKLIEGITPKPTTIGFVVADAEFAQNSIGSVRALAKSNGFKVVYDQSYPMSTVDMSSIVRGLKAADPEVVMVFTYPQHSTAFIRSVSEVGLGPNAKLVGGGMVGMQFANALQALGPALNGFVTFHFYVPGPTMDRPSTTAFLKIYQAAAEKEGVDPLGFYIPTFAYARLEVLQKAIEATGSLDEGKLADYLRATPVETVVGKVAFGPTGERLERGAIFVQYRGITDAGGLDQFKRAGTQVIVSPKALASGSLVVPFSAARK
ncbi:MAG: amino acid ABC transporter substrate-binding protein [Burkholderiaceae bacterium]|nr:amino acid ABC transporter substrate-binding protein [Burkholderiaceae bacterium]